MQNVNNLLFVLVIHLWKDDIKSNVKITFGQITNVFGVVASFVIRSHKLWHTFTLDFKHSLWCNDHVQVLIDASVVKSVKLDWGRFHCIKETDFMMIEQIVAASLQSWGKSIIQFELDN